MKRKPRRSVTRKWSFKFEFTAPESRRQPVKKGASAISSPTELAMLDYVRPVADKVLVSLASHYLIKILESAGWP